MRRGKDRLIGAALCLLLLFGAGCSPAPGADQETLDRELDVQLGLLAEVPVQELELMDLISRLPEEQRACILLRFYQDLTYRETAQVLGIPESTVKARTKAALRRLFTGPF